MTYPTRAPFAPDPSFPTPLNKTHSQRSTASALTRPYGVAWLGNNGHVNYETVNGPALAVIENACGAVARGAVVSTDKGQMAIEDLEPGMRVLTVEHGPLPIQWIGSYDLTPRDAQRSDRNTLIRVTSDMFGLGKPAEDLLMGPRAHVLIQHESCRRLFGRPTAYAPVRAFEDGMSVFSVKPMSAVTVYNLAFDRQASIVANGVEIETFHPGPHAEAFLDEEMLYALLRLFPNARSLQDFGPQLTQRLTSFEVRNLREAA